MKSTYYRRDDCRLCYSKDIVVALHLKPTPIADEYLPKERLKDPQPLFPLDLYLCQACGHAQLLDVIPPDILFKDYIYVSASSLNLDKHFQQYADDIVKKFNLSAGKSVLDIGSNDGTLLKFFKAKGLKVLGVDPAKEIAKKSTSEGIETIIEYFRESVGTDIRKKYGPMDLITANNVFAHADDMGDVAEGVRALLAPDGVFVFEVSYLLDLMEGMVFDYVYHEHLCHHSVKPLKKFLALHGLELIDIQRVPTKGGSLRGAAQLARGPKPISPSVGDFIKMEDKFGLDKLSTFRAFENKITVTKNQLLDLLSGLTKKGETVAGYGASATTTTLIYHFDLGEKLPYIFDDNPQRQNLFSPGLHLPIISPAEIAVRKPDYILILAWRFATPIIEKQRAYRDRGGRFILPLPDVKIV